MKAVLPVVPPEILELRKRTGADRWDEMWNGVLHMPPMCNRSHQDLEYALESYLRRHWAPRSGGKVYHQINVASIGGWTKDYRIPDLVLLYPENFEIDRNEYFEGPPDVVVEIHSPGDEAYEKLEFYARLGVTEVWIIDRDAKEPQVHVLAGEEYKKLGPEAGGWLRSPRTSVEFRPLGGGRLALRIAGDAATREDLG